MVVKTDHDFSGYATKAGLKCSDGRTILPEAFQHMDGLKIPLVWQHGHSDPDNVLGHAILEARDDGVYAYGYFNQTSKAQNTKLAVEHKDLDSLSIYANQLQEIAKRVSHGNIREVSLVLAGANPGAKIDFVNIRHGDGTLTELDDEAVIEMGIELEHSSGKPEDPDKTEGQEHPDNLSHADEDLTVKEIFDDFTDEEKNVVYYMIGDAVSRATQDAAAHADNQPDENSLVHQEGAGNMPRNVFDQTSQTEDGEKRTALSHDAMKAIFADAAKLGSLREAVDKYASTLQHGVENIDILFPDAKMVGTIELEKRRTEWVAAVLNGTRHTPFSRIKTLTADLTQDEARAKGYIKGKYKLEEWFGVTKRKTGPTTIYKKQKIDRDDLLDITDFDMVSFLKGEMRLMTEEEIARAILIGDGRNVVAEDKVKDPLGVADGDGIRSIVNDHELFVTTLYVNVGDANSNYEEVVDAVMDGMEFYKGTGTPTFFTTIPELNKFMKEKDLNGRRYYETRAAVAAALGVKDVITVEPMKELTDVIGIIVNLDDYNVGTDKGGELTMFDDFDIDYNQYKYLLETRMSGALVRPKSALIIKKTASANVKVSPDKPTFVASTGVVTIPTKTGVVYKDSDGDTLTAGAQTALAAGVSTMVYAVPASGYYFPNTAEDSWPFKRPAA